MIMRVIGILNLYNKLMKYDNYKLLNISGGNNLSKMGRGKV
jgi:hypothetical protein